MKAAERQLRIRDLFEAAEFLDLATLCRKLRSSESTVRRDLIALEREGVVRRVHGGALAAPREAQDYDFVRHSSRMAGEKARIAAAAAAQLEDGQIVILDGGSTTAAVARELLPRSLHVLTNSLPIAEALKGARRLELTLTGGYLHGRLGVLLGPLTEQMLSSVAADVLIMGTGGITETGFSNNDALLVGSQRTMIAVARRVVVVADHTKFGRSAMVPVAPLAAAHLVVSDRGLEPRFQDLLRSQGVELILA